LGKVRRAELREWEENAQNIMKGIKQKQTTKHYLGKGWGWGGVSGVGVKEGYSKLAS
jgi:hypothetical protein